MQRTHHPHHPARQTLGLHRRITRLRQHLVRAPEHRHPPQPLARQPRLMGDQRRDRRRPDLRRPRPRLAQQTKQALALTHHQRLRERPIAAVTRHRSADQQPREGDDDSEEPGLVHPRAPRHQVREYILVWHRQRP
jgi:hypothetical protein